MTTWHTKAKWRAVMVWAALLVPTSLTANQVEADRGRVDAECKTFPFTIPPHKRARLSVVLWEEKNLTATILEGDSLLLRLDLETLPWTRPMGRMQIGKQTVDFPAAESERTIHIYVKKAGREEWLQPHSLPATQCTAWPVGN